MSQSAARRRALLSVSDKRGLPRFAKRLLEAGYELVSTGGTAKLLAEHGIEHTPVSDITGFPEIMDGRVKTLHPKVHGGLLGRLPTDAAVMQEHDIAPIDILVVNLYPFEETVARPGATRNEIIENIDIGGPAMVRAAAKNHQRVAVIVAPEDYDSVTEQLGDGIDEPTRVKLAAKAFAHTAAYDSAIAQHLEADRHPLSLTRAWTLDGLLRYGENPHQQGAFYRERNAAPGTLGAAELLQGKALSYNNLADADAALGCVREFSEPTVVIVKHANPCGVASSDNLLTAYDRAFGCDPQSAFGGIIAINGELKGDLASAIIDRQFVEVILAPSVSEAALEVLSAKPRVRVLETGHWDALQPTQTLKWISGGVLVQDEDSGGIQASDLTVATRKKPTAEQLADLRFAWRVCKHVKSNAIVIAGNQCAFGVGAGQMSRVMSVRIASTRAAESEHSTMPRVLASDAFFPFADGIDEAAKAKVDAIIQPGGSMRDDEVIAKADELGIAMVLTGMRHFRH